MKKYAYQAIAHTGEIKTGELSAKSLMDAKIKILSENYRPINVELVREAVVGKNESYSVDQKLVFWTKLNSLLELNLTLKVAFAKMSELGFFSDVKLTDLSLDLFKQLTQGNKLSDAAKTHVQFFDEIEIELVKSAEKNSMMLQVSQEIVQFYSIQSDHIKSLSHSLKYIAGIGAAMWGMLFMTFSVVIPVISSKLAVGSAGFSLITYKLINFTYFINKNIFSFGLFAILTYLLFVYACKNDWFDLFSKVHTMRAHAKFLRHLAWALKLGRQESDAVVLAINSNDSEAIKSAAARSKAKLENKIGLIAALREEKLMPQTAKSLDENTILRAAQYCEEKYLVQFNKTIKDQERFLYIIFTSIMCFVVLCFMLPFVEQIKLIIRG